MSQGDNPRGRNAITRPLCRRIRSMRFRLQTLARSDSVCCRMRRSTGAFCSLVDIRISPALDPKDVDPSPRSAFLTTNAARRRRRVHRAARRCGSSMAADAHLAIVTQPHRVVFLRPTFAFRPSLKGSAPAAGEELGSSTNSFW